MDGLRCSLLLPTGAKVGHKTGSLHKLEELHNARCTRWGLAKYSGARTRKHLFLFYGSDHRDQGYNIQDAWHDLMNLYWPETEALGGSLVRVSVHTRVFVTLNVMAGNLVLAKVMSGLRRFGETLPPPANRPRPGFDPGFRWGHQSTTSTIQDNQSTPSTFPIDPSFDPLFRTLGVFVVPRGETEDQ